MPTPSMRRRFLLVVLFTLVSSNFGRSMSTSGSFSPSEAPHMPWRKPSSEPPSIPDPSPLYRGPVAGPSTSTFPRHHHHPRHLEPISVTPAPSTTPGNH
ncbi:hypothetical protein RHSIM_Rhsim13G0041300 [Rhododendron simsii]|uniref:Uncharacterized protein n=1 Tax=Rhododendron simsii TaxID=118357 RepID=A0A834G5K8_RHOSS|nr:hypothetical protein RHSIM_Rhsim13G0041300 [Rhododendron simsii]